MFEHEITNIMASRNVFVALAILSVLVIFGIMGVIRLISLYILPSYERAIAFCQSSSKGACEYQNMRYDKEFAYKEWVFNATKENKNVIVGCSLLGRCIER